MVVPCPEHQSEVVAAELQTADVPCIVAASILVSAPPSAQNTAADNCCGQLLQSLLLLTTARLRDHTCSGHLTACESAPLLSGLCG